MESHPHDFDAIVIGTGFAGAVTACRLTQAGLRICVIERGRRYVNAEADLPVYPKAAESGQLPDFSRLLWGATQGLWDLRDLGDVLVAQAAGYGGGSLIYANVHLRAPEEVFDERWPDRYRGGNLATYYDLAAFMLQVETMPDPPPGQDPLHKTARMREAARATGAAFFSPPLAVNFHSDGQNRFGRRQRPCDLRGDCCFGCSRHAKNTLDLNYLAVAEDTVDSKGKPLATIYTLKEVVAVHQRTNKKVTHYQVDFLDRNTEDRPTSITAPYVFVCAGAVNSTELLMRSLEAGSLEASGSGLGDRYSPNADGFAAVFDSEKPQEADRGPTITSAMLWQGAPDDQHSSARWTMPFAKGCHEPVEGCILRSSGGARARLAGAPRIDSGSWADGSATGEFTVAALSGHFETNEEVLWESRNGGRHPVAVCTEPPRKIGHWLLVQDGGMPAELEPLLGVLRSPLWLRRNRYREDGRAVPPSGTAYAQLPFGNLAEALSQFMQQAGTSGVARNLAMSVGRPQGPSRGWEIVPKQLLGGLEEWKEYLLEMSAIGAQPIIGRFLKEAGEQAQQAFDLEQMLRKFPLPGGYDPSLVRRIQVTERLLRMGVQLIWGSEGEMLRGGAEEFIRSTLMDDDEFLKRLTELLLWAMDYRMSDGHTALLLSMGRDTQQGRLSLVSGLKPTAGSRIQGQESMAERFLVRVEVEEGSWSAATARGTMVVIGDQGDLLPGETLLTGDRDLGVFEEEVETKPPEWLAECTSASPGQLKALQEDLTRMRRIRFGPQDPPVAPEPRLRAELPPPMAATEWSTQELLLRDMAEHWKGELRTDPMWTLQRRRVTVHSQGGCPMGSDKATGFTDGDGQVFGCPGLYVMDAAAFPTSVGVNPSATITAVAELKIEDFIRAYVDGGWSAPELREAQEWAEANQPMLRPPPLYATEPSPYPASAPVGIGFSEKMSGSGSQPDGTRLNVGFNLDIRILDLSRFLELDARGKPEPLEVHEGTVTTSGSQQVPRRLRVQPGSHIWLRRDPVEGSRERRTMEYRLELRDPESGAFHTLIGAKNIRDDQGLDVLSDTTTLFYKLFDANGQEVIEKGKLDLLVEDFLSYQIPSMKAFGTEDRSRQSWALAAFGQYFFGHLVDVYVPELEGTLDILELISRSTHA